MGASVLTLFRPRSPTPPTPRSTPPTNALPAATRATALPPTPRSMPSASTTALASTSTRPTAAPLRPAPAPAPVRALAPAPALALVRALALALALALVRDPAAVLMPLVLEEAPPPARPLALRLRRLHPWPQATPWSAVRPLVCWASWLRSLPSKSYNSIVIPHGGGWKVGTTV